MNIRPIQDDWKYWKYLQEQENQANSQDNQDNQANNQANNQDNQNKKNQANQQYHHANQANQENQANSQDSQANNQDNQANNQDTPLLIPSIPPSQPRHSEDNQDNQENQDNQDTPLRNPQPSPQYDENALKYFNYKYQEIDWKEPDLNNKVKQIRSVLKGFEKLLPFSKLFLLLVFCSWLGFVNCFDVDQQTLSSSSIVQEISQNNMVFVTSMKLLAISLLRQLIYYLKNYRGWTILHNYVHKIDTLFEGVDSSFVTSSYGTMVKEWKDLIIRDASILDQRVPYSLQLLRNKYIAEIEQKIEYIRSGGRH